MIQLFYSIHVCEEPTGSQSWRQGGREGVLETQLSSSHACIQNIQQYSSTSSLAMLLLSCH